MDRFQIEQASPNEIREGPYRACIIDGADRAAIDACLQLRYDHFVCAKGWAPDDPAMPGRETDHYDQFAWHLAVVASMPPDEGDEPVVERVVTYLRALPGSKSCGFMLDHEFACLLTDEQRSAMHRNQAVEVSRLIFTRAGGTRGQVSSCHAAAAVCPAELLLKALYQLSLQHGICHYYVVAEPAWLRALASGLHMRFAAIGEPYTFPDGTTTVAAHATRSELEQAVARADPEKLRWYQTLESSARPCW